MVLTQSGSLQLLLDLIGVFVFALSGGLVAVRKRLDILGVVILSGMAGLGGGVLRDLLIGQTPPVGVSDWRLMGVCVLAGLCAFTLHPEMSRIARLVRLLDAAGLALFCVAGSIKALAYGAGATTAIFVGVLTAIGGGLMRDVIVGQVPEVLRRELYVVPALLGSSLVVIAHETPYYTVPVLWGCVFVAFALRMIAVVLDLNAPQPLRTGDRS
ncbi:MULTISPECIES: trimeric intracellular cation channel family protein [Dermacoccus]|uniref:Trimeric intracellular cation channel family protein n=2 Tax=Dermacoccus TaxID=57495 RepID=A0A417Z6J5_9MICO|nr:MULTISPECIES: trimeric intracellular cation channel family protein [Dermacoccus]KLO63101.1 membrane protein [Dermacoccus sp. PE3]MBE7371823.1 trimeric intracellular cation channel family protein [Dermacoccus barathri]MCT1985946.1 trimeric intracellular cation channel family protein [Dermacoccus abyssi]QEH93087.1 trimeric intracellular cation channel family protein [Dermacoccus abyssi]QNK52278.1 trimeric intracellular cation channel family protein [Dermacoccus sp. PAMC28757]